MALSADAVRITRGTPKITRYAIGTAARLYIGSLVCIRNTTGRALAATAATGRKFGGMAVSFEGTNQSGLGVTAASEFVNVAYDFEVQLTVATAIRTNSSLGLRLFVGDDNKVSGTAVGTAGKRVPVGELISWIDGTGAAKTTGWIHLREVISNIAV